MSVIVISSVGRFIEMSRKLEGLGLQNLHFYNSQNDGGLNTPIAELLPFVDCVVLGKDANLLRHLDKVIDEAFARHIPVLSEDCFHEIKNFCF